MKKDEVFVKKVRLPNVFENYLFLNWKDDRSPIKLVVKKE